jgi:phospholipid/cholesterol/gamma-HCH transport system substrate-binding protein
MTRPTRRMRRGLRAAALAVTATLALGGCEFSVYELPLPGGADVGENPYTVTAYFDNVMDLVPQSAVKVNDVTVGKVEDVELAGYTAKVDLLLRGDVRLPDNAVATIRQTSLLGEKFVSLSAPLDQPPVGTLDPGEELTLAQTGRNPEVEEVFGALSLLLNGGGIGQLKTITAETNKMLAGNETEIRSLLTQLDTFTGQLDRNKADIIDAIESLNRLAKSTKAQTSSITNALDRMPRALDSLDKQRDDLIRMLKALGRLSDVGTRVIRASEENTVRSLESLAPILSQLADAGKALPKAMEVFFTYPFVNAVVGSTPAEARNLHQGDYTNLSAKLDLDLRQLLTNPPGLPGQGGGGGSPLGDVEDGLRDLQDGVQDGRRQLEDRLRDGRRQLEDQLPGDTSTDPRRRELGGTGDGTSGDGSEDCVLGVVCRARPGFAGHVQTDAADTARLGYDPDVAALLLQGVNVR